MTRQVWIVALLTTFLLSGCGVRYVATSAFYQAELLLDRQPVEDVLRTGTLSAGQEQRLRLILELKRYGRNLGLSNTHNYDAVSLHWNRVIWNLSACPPLAFEPRTWWFPIVGRVPYLGFFREEDAEAEAKKLRAQGFEVHRRTAGAYSTLGWFRDPVLPSMLRWDEDQLAETVFHELAHATLWIPGSVPFNESFASVVGDTAARRWLTDRYGPDSAEVAAHDRVDRDSRRFKLVLHQLYQDLDKVYRDPALTEAEKLERKATILASLPDRVTASPIEDQRRYQRNVTTQKWNNARLMQFKAYNSNDDLFAVLLERAGGDLPRFIDSIATLTRHRRDPFVALREAASVKIP